MPAVDEIRFAPPSPYGLRSEPRLFRKDQAALSSGLQSGSMLFRKDTTELAGTLSVLTDVYRNTVGDTTTISAAPAWALRKVISDGDLLALADQVTILVTPFELTPRKGAVTGGTPFLVSGAGFDMSAQSDSFSDGVLGSLWSDDSIANGTVSEGFGYVRLVAGSGDIAAIRSTGAYGNLDAEAEFSIQLAQSAIGSSVVLAQVSLQDISSQTILDWRIEYGTPIPSRPSGQWAVMRMTTGGLTTRHAAFYVSGLDPQSTFRLRIVRADARVWFLLNGRAVHQDSWVGGSLMHIRLAAGSGVGNTSSVQSRLLRYVRRPMVLFGRQPTLEYTSWSSRTISGYTPAVDSSSDGTYEFSVDTGTSVQSRPSWWTYTRQDNRVSWGSSTRSLSALMDPTVKKTGRS